MNNAKTSFDTPKRKGRDIIPDAVWDWIFEQYERGDRLDVIEQRLPRTMRFASFRAFQNGFYLRRPSLEARAAQRRACKHEWKPLGFTLDGDGGLRPTDVCRCGATQYATV